jgi:alkaline phosphatase D
MSGHHRRRFTLMPRPAISRRLFLKNLAAAGSAAGLSALGACGSSSPGSSPTPGAPTVPPGGLRFLHGVASGDPRVDRVILWTRITLPEPGPEVAVDWIISSSPTLDVPLAGGRFITGPERDYTVKVDAAGLASFSTYYYRFSVTQSDGSVVTSPIGRTKTAPAANDAVTRVRAAVASCSNYAFGFFSAYRHIAARADLDLVIHLGDYLYETGGGQVRNHEPDREIVTLADYRQRHAQYKTDPDLQEAHRQHPWITTWDDHESTDNSYRTGANNHTEGEEGCWEERLGWAIRAYFEWMPIRDNGRGFDAPIQGPGQTCEPGGEPGLLPEGLGRIYRTIPYGSLIDFVMLDTRHAGRAAQNGVDIVAEEQTILGAEQREWFLQELPSRSATWKIVGTGVGFAPLRTGVNPVEGCANPIQSIAGPECFLNEDSWDGYRFDRNAVFDMLEQSGVQNTVMIFGDIHAVIACDLPRDGSDPLGYNPVTGQGSFGVELCCGGIANLPLPIWNGIRPFNPHMKHVAEGPNGFMLMDITPERLQAEWYYAAVQAPDAPEVPDPVMLQTAVNSQRLTPAPQRSAEKADAPPPAP